MTTRDQHKFLESGNDDELAGNGPGDGYSFSVSGNSRELMAADLAFLADKVGRRHFDFRLGVHEGGHTVASYILLSCVGSSIEYIDGHFGLTWSNDAALEPSTDTVESICAALKPLMPGALDSELEEAHSHVIAWLAGVAAEEIFCSEPPLARTGHDIAAARAVAALIVREVSDIDSYIDRARTETRALLIDQAASVLAVANALIEFRTIDGEQIATLIANAQHNEIERE
jgi:hypothetical protein